LIHQSHHTIAHVLQVIAGGGLGLASASLANRFGFRSADRLPGESRLPSCYFCLQPLTWQNAFPLIGWLLRPDVMTLPCPCGKRRGFWPQPFVEILGFILGITAVLLGGWPGMSIPLALGLGLLPAIAMVDLHFGIIPDEANLLLGVIGFWFLMAGGGDTWLQMIVFAVLLALGLFCALVYSRWRGKEMLGIGDVKFFAAAGMWIHPDMVPWFLSMAGFSGILIGWLWKRAGGGKEFPFGPALCLSLIGCVIYQIVRM
jgi:leader peptidase (prepilin peptidase)/N-methyltransferase